MTDKVQKIREEVEKRYNYWKEKESNSHSIESEIRMSECQHLLLMLDSQEEPVSEDLEEAAWFYADKKCHLDIAVFTSDEVKKEREKMQFTWQDLYDAVMFGAKWQKEKDSILPKVWNRENLDEFSYQTAYDLSNDWMKEIPTWDDVEIACKLGAKWQKSKDQSTIELAEDHAYFAGSEAMREKILREIEEAYKKGGVIEAMKIIRELKK